MISSEETYQRMLNCQPGDAFHEMFSFVVRVRSLPNNRVIVTQHNGTGPVTKKITFDSKQDFADHYSYKSKPMAGKSFLRWASTGFGYSCDIECICESANLLNNGCCCK